MTLYWLPAARGACWAGFFISGLVAGAIRGPGTAALLLAIWIAAPFAAAILLMHCATRRQRRHDQAAWRGGEATVHENLPAVNAARLDQLEKQVGLLEHREEGCEGELDLIRDGLAAAFDAADLAWPAPRAHLRLVRAASGEHTTLP